MAEVEAFSLPERLCEEIRSLVRAGYYSSKSDVAKDAFRCLLEHKPALKKSSALQLYLEKKVSIGRAAEIAEISTAEFKDLLADRELVRSVSVGADAKKQADLIRKHK